MRKSIRVATAWVCLLFSVVGCTGCGMVQSAQHDKPPAGYEAGTPQNPDMPPGSGVRATQTQTVVRSFSNPESFSSDVHVLHSEKGNVLVDPGYYGEDLAGYVESIGGLDAILITHGHWDNIFALDAAAAANPDAQIYMHELDYGFLKDPVLNASAPNGFLFTTETTPQTFTEGVFHIGGYDFEVIHTPGHTCGCCCFYFEVENILFSGDMFMIPFVGSVDHPTGNEDDRAASIEKFKRRDFPGDMQIYPGHRGNTTYTEIMKTNADLQ